MTLEQYNLGTRYSIEGVTTSKKNLKQIRLCAVQIIQDRVQKIIFKDKEIVWIFRIVYLPLK